MKKIYIIIITIVLIAVTVFVHQKNESNENTEMERFAKIVSNETDSYLEQNISDIILGIKNDSLINSWFNNNPPSDDSVYFYIKTKYFNNSDLFKSYNIAFAICDNNTYLNLEDNSEILCNEWFSDLIQSDDVSSINDNLFHIDDPTTDTYYATSIDLPNSHTLFFEFYKELNLNALKTNYLKNCSFSIYKNNILDYKYGNYLYPNNLKNFISQDDGFHKGKKYKHLIYNDLNSGKTVVVTIEFERWMRFVAPFSIIFFLLLLAYSLYVYFSNDRQNHRLSFHSKMQITILLTLAFSFVIVGLVSFLFLNNNITKKTEITQYKQANIIRNRLESNIINENSLTNKDYLKSLEESFLCDINIYDLDGNLINTTIKEGFDNVDIHFISESAFKNIIDDGAGYFMQTEFYGDEKCSSYYFPILDKNNELIAVLNVPYFESNSDYDDRISNFILNYINIIVVLLGISSIIVLLITRKTLKPLRIIEEQMGKISLDGINEPIDFKGRDEIGALIQQYNNMCKQLESAANKLARNERENAWREMARQVAHEIKNPLTPMRLNIEYLQMLWDRKDPKFEANFKETLNSLLEQIETLSNIATAFSDYAKLPENKPSIFDLSDLLKSTIKIYDVEKNIIINYNFDEKEDWILFADKNNLSRVLGNIIKNAIQAIGLDDGRIEVILSRLGERYQIRISDNGCGIKEEDKSKVFIPNFTTKSSGMGVGLSVSQDIIQGMGGNITFESEVGEGTVFTIDLPILKEM